MTTPTVQPNMNQIPEAGEAKMVDLELGGEKSGGKDGVIGSPADDHPPELYMSVADIATLHPESNINVANIEASKGLSSAEALKRLEIHGKNALTPPKKIPEWKRFLQQFQSLFLIILIGSAILSIITYAWFGDITNLYLGIVLLVVVFFTGLLQFHEEGKASKVIDSFKNLLATNCTAMRNGKSDVVNVDVLVPGDLVLVKNGDKVPADMVLLLCRDLKTDNSALTGEAEPISCTSRPSSPGLSPYECHNMAFNGSLCYDGMAVGLVLRTGDKSTIGTIAKLSSDTQQRESTLQKEVRNFVRLVAVIAIAMATGCFVASIFLTGASTADEIIKLFVNGFLIIIVANVPQGLPSTVVSLLSLAARHMALKSVLVKRIDCVETLGSCSVIASDKTGTLTKNEMTVTDIWYDQRFIKRQRREAKSLSGQEPQALLFRAAILCNRAELISKKVVTERETSVRNLQIQRVSNVSRLSWGGSVRDSLLNQDDEAHEGPKFTGNPSDVALLKYCDQLQSVQDLRSHYPIVFEVPFNSTNKWQLVIVKSLASTPEEEGETEYEVLMKGAPEVILGMCSTYSTQTGASHKVEVTDEFRRKFKETYEHCASQGRRVLAVCSKSFRAPTGCIFNSDGPENNKYNFPTTDLNFIGVLAIMDPPRDNVPDAIAKCLSAGVRVFMVTGDHPFTARAIAKQIGLLKGDNNIELLENETSTEDWDSCDGAVIHGSRIDALTDDQWHSILSKKGGICFARTTPAHKLLIVEKCQTLKGEIVAVTGDGVNDAPALKQADIGIAMGLNGSAVAQDAADILLMDDNFASIVAGIEEGRIIFDNIKKTIAYTMAHIFPEVFAAFLALLVGLPAGLTSMQVLTIDLGTELGPAISLAYETAESNIMDRKPRDPLKDRLVSPSLLFYSYITSGFVISVGCLVAYILTYSENGLHMSDFFRPGLDAANSDFFTLTASDSVEVQRTGRIYTAEEQHDIFSEGVTAFYITLTLAQFCHIWACKTRLNSLFTHGIGNKLTFYGVGIGLGLVIFFCYIPGVQTFVGSTAVGLIPWVAGLVTGTSLFLYNEAAKWISRRSKPTSTFNRFFSW